MKGKIFLLLIATLFIGMAINIPTEEDRRIITQEKLDEFEENVVIKDNDYVNIVNSIDPTPFNKAGKKVERLIDKGFDFCFGIIKGMIDNDEQ